MAREREFGRQRAFSPGQGGEYEVMEVIFDSTKMMCPV